MTGELTSQILFDSQAGFKPVHISMLLDFNTLWDKHKVSINKGLLTDAYFEGLRDISEKHDVTYVMPKFHNGLEGVGTSPTVH